MSTQYSCGNCELATARYTAVGNVPKHSHLCTLCWEQDKNREHYEKITMVPKVKEVPPDGLPLLEGVDYVSAYPPELLKHPVEGHEFHGAGSKAAAMLANNSLYGKIAPNKPIKKVESGFLAISTLVPVPPEMQVSVMTQPECEMTLTRLIVARSVAVHFNLRGILIANTQKFAGVGEVSMEIFWGDDERPDIPPILLDYKLFPWHRLALAIYNHSKDPQPFNATFLANLYLP